MIKILVFVAAIWATLPSIGYAETINVGDLTIQHAALRATVPGAKVGVGYLTIENSGAEPERLISGRSSFAGRFEIHEMKMESQIMKMRPLKNGVQILAGSVVRLAPGGNHIMFMQLKEQLLAGEQQQVTLIFENAGEVPVMFTIKSIAETMHMKHGD